ncbi:MAG: hypothetical protein P1U44_07310 [Vicingaceae bacterium]|jgi:hypothetical protein|nr:hypothetical protein [Flavobacteriales bacterium]MBQ19621.1 hypothetical protein [Flavobacteriales bacterium]MDF1675513.1 hypothetical protein [Vicingaceae bacterium]|tara:strand:- start:44974 stop:45426 length:453 start_codon:yes stop_codon:yes gene_type:complete
MFLSFYEIFFLLVFSATKFMASALYILAIKRISWTSTFLILLIGGCLGILVFYFLGSFINQLIDRLLSRWKKDKLSANKFSSSSRRIINIKSKYGLIGISLLTPLLFSIPLGCFFATRFFKRSSQTLIIMLFGVVFWTVVLSFTKFVVSM